MLLASSLLSNSATAVKESRGMFGQRCALGGGVCMEVWGVYAKVWGSVGRVSEEKKKNYNLYPKTKMLHKSDLHQSALQNLFSFTG